MSEDLIREGDMVLLYYDRKRSYLVKVDAGRVLHTHKGTVEVGGLVGRSWGVGVSSHLGARFTVLKPTIRDRVQKIARGTQILYPKDTGLIIAYTGMGPGWRIAEAGTGSGALTAQLAHIVRPEGRVYTYEVRGEFIEIARKNLEKLGLLPYVEMKNRDVLEGVEEGGLDAVVLDLATPWLVVPHAHKALRGSGFLVSFSPTIDQVEKTAEAMEGGGFECLETIEAIVRRYQVKPGQTRPETLMIGHTGYLTFGRKVVEA